MQKMKELFFSAFLLAIAPLYGMDSQISEHEGPKSEVDLVALHVHRQQQIRAAQEARFQQARQHFDNGVLYLTGKAPSGVYIGVSTQPEDAVRYLTQAASLNYPPAWDLLAGIAERGTNIRSPDILLALFWYDKLAGQDSYPDLRDKARQKKAAYAYGIGLNMIPLTNMRKK